MTATAHALVAGAIAQSIPNPFVSVPLAFISHFLMDIIPHWDLGTDWRGRSKTKTGLLAIGETVLGITLAYFVFAEKVEPQLLLFTIIASEIPDWLEAPWYMFFAKHNTSAPAPGAGFWEKLTYGIYRAENVFHAKAPFPLGVLTQILTVAFFLMLLG